MKTKTRRLRGMAMERQWDIGTFHYHACRRCDTRFLGRADNCPVCR